MKEESQIRVKGRTIQNWNSGWARRYEHWLMFKFLRPGLRVYGRFSFVILTGGHCWSGMLPFSIWMEEEAWMDTQCVQTSSCQSEVSFDLTEPTVNPVSQTMLNLRWLLNFEQFSTWKTFIAFWFIWCSHRSSCLFWDTESVFVKVINSRTSEETDPFYELTQLLCGLQLHLSFFNGGH